MEVTDLPAAGHFVNEKNEIRSFLQLKGSDDMARSVVRNSKKYFLEQYPDNELDYERYKHFVEVFNKRSELSYFEFAEFLRNEYGYILDEIKEQKSAKNSLNINTIKNILVFFTWIWFIGAIITIFFLLVKN